MLLLLQLIIEAPHGRERESRKRPLASVFTDASYKFLPPPRARAFSPRYAVFALDSLIDRCAHANLNF